MSATPNGFWEWVKTNRFMWPANEGQERTFSKFAQPEQIVEITDLMLSNGYSDEDIRGVLGGNFRRVCAEAWK